MPWGTSHTNSPHFAVMTFLAEALVGTEREHSTASELTHGCQRFPEDSRCPVPYAP